MSGRREKSIRRADGWTRDEREFDNPDAFDIRRPRKPNAAFGFGPHFCAGHAFARDQERIALQMLVEAMPDLRFDEAYGPIAFKGWEFRAPTSLHARW